MSRHFGVAIGSGLMIGWAFLMSAQSTSTPSHPDSSRADDHAYLFSFFRDNGQAGLFLAGSSDGLKWQELKAPGRSFLVPELGDKLMRDPCLRVGPDGVFRLVWTTGWKDRIIGYSDSPDLVHWRPQKEIPVMKHEKDARNAWAPELFYDEAARQWLIFWATTIPGRFPATEGAGDDSLNHRMYYVTTRDFEQFSPTRLFYDGGYNVIDATLLKVANRYALMVKDETLKPVQKNLRLAYSSQAEGPFGPASPPFTKSWVEGPSALYIDQFVYVYYDHYRQPQHMGALRSQDLEQWEDVTALLSFPAGARHGTVSRVPARKIKDLTRID